MSNEIHYRKGMTGCTTWCGVPRDTYAVLRGEPDNTSPFLHEVTCEKCDKLAAEWLAKYHAKRKKEALRAKETKGMSHLSQKIYDERKEAEAKAIDSLARYKFQMFGYWAGVWVHLNKISEDPQPNPFAKLVKMSKEMRDA